MIIAFEGTPGSGKSYDAVREIVNNLRLRRIVYTNIEGMDDPGCQRFLQDFLEFDDFEFKTYFHWLPDSDFSHFWDLKETNQMWDGQITSEKPFVKDGSLLVIDEIHKIFSNRDWSTEKNRQFSDWCSTHRHKGFDVYFVTQHLDKVEKQVRSLIEWTYVYRKVNFLGSLSKNRYIKYAYSGDDTKGKPLNTISRNYELKIFKCYKSMVNDNNVKLNIMPQVNILKHPVFYVIPLVLCLFLYMLFGKSSFATGDILGTSKLAHKRDGVQSPPSPIPNLPVAAPVVPFSKNSSSSVPVHKKYSSVQPVPNVVTNSSNAITVKGHTSMNGKTFLLLSDGRMVASSKVISVGSVYKN